MLERSGSELTLGQQANLLSVSRSSLYYVPCCPPEWEVRAKHRIDEIYTEHPYYGSRRMQFTLAEEGFRIGRDAVRTFMREMGIEAMYPKRDLSKPNPEHRIFPYLLRGVTSAYPNHVWGIDITYIRMRHGWMYLVAILDWYSRYVVSWELSETMEIDFVLTCVERALSLTAPTIFNSDRGAHRAERTARVKRKGGSHFTSPKCVDMVRAAGAQVSMDGRGRAMDNIFTERLWRTVKYEHVYLNDYDRPKDARKGLAKYLHFYCEQRPHQALGYRRPGAVYRSEE